MHIVEVPIGLFYDLIKACEDVVDSADDSGCNSGLTAVKQKCVTILEERLAALKRSEEVSVPYARCSWNEEDVRCLERCEYWSDERCVDFLLYCKKYLEQTMTEHGWDVMEEMLPGFIGENTSWAN